MESSAVQTPSSSLVPFENLPNLPKPIIPQIDLGIQRVDVESLALAIQDSGSISSRRKVGFFLADRCTQTESSDVLDLKQTTSVIQTLVQDVGQLRKDLNFAQNVLKADYENRLNERAIELYCRCNDRCSELEKLHKEKVEIVRKSYRSQLNNAIQKIAGEYQAYYDELLQGKTGRTDAKIRELRQKIEMQELQLEQGVETISELTQKVNQYEEEFGHRETEEAPPPAPPPGITLEEAEELRETIDRLDGELIELRAELAAKEDAGKKLTRQLETTNRQLEDEKGKVVQLKRDMEALKKKTKSEQEKAARMAENQRAAMEKEWKDKAEAAEKDAARKAEEQADLQRIRDQSKFQEELDRRKHLEDQLRANQQRTPTPPPADGDLGAQLERLQKIEQKQKLEIERLKNEFERMNKVWEMKLAIMQRNFHALKDESYIRHSLQRQAASLHHATVGYAAKGHRTGRTTRHLKPLPQIKARSRDTDTSSSQQTGALGDSPLPLSSPLAPSPTPQHSAREPSPTRTVHFSQEQLHPRTHTPSSSPIPIHA